MFVWQELAPCAANQTAPKPGQAPSTVEVFFSEAATADDPDLLDKLKGMKVWRLSAAHEPQAIDPIRADDSLAVKLTGNEREFESSLFVATHDLGIRERGGEAFRLVYYAKSGPPADAPAWSDVTTKAALALNVIPSVEAGQVDLLVSFSGSPAAKAEVNALGPGMEAFTGETDAVGKISFALADAGRYSIRVRHTEQVRGKVTPAQVTQTVDVGARL